MRWELSLSPPSCVLWSDISGKVNGVDGVLGWLPALPQHPSPQAGLQDVLHQPQAPYGMQGGGRGPRPTPAAGSSLCHHAWLGTRADPGTQCWKVPLVAQCRGRTGTPGAGPGPAHCVAAGSRFLALCLSFLHQGVGTPACCVFFILHSVSCRAPGPARRLPFLKPHHRTLLLLLKVLLSQCSRGVIFSFPSQFPSSQRSMQPPLAALFLSMSSS